MLARTRSRRDFLRDSAALIAAGATVPQFLARTSRAAAATPRKDDNILVVVQLTGGNDGLNTIIPHCADAYYRSRPTIAVPRGQSLKLDDSVGLHPRAVGLKSLYDDGLLTIIQGVGYPNPDRSHFSAMDIWHSADPSHTKIDTGWLGRAADCACGTHTAKAHTAPWAIQLDHEPLPLALRGHVISTPSIHDIDSLKIDTAGNRALAESIESVASSKRSDASDTLLYVQRAAVAACENARRLEQVAHDSHGAAAYPATDLARKLRQIATLIGADLGTRVYYTSIGGFDTHAKQTIVHGDLMAELGDALSAFFADLKARGLAERVLLMTFSEFGRRVEENGSQGTDHGAAAPMLLVGHAGKGGLVGDAPDLTRLVDGDVRHQIDFRGVYATILEQHLQLSARQILAGSFAAVHALRRN